MVVAPHHLAAEAGQRVLREGGNAIEAMVAAAATIAVVYPHMNGLGGDNFWLISRPGEAPEGLQACGGAAARADVAFYRDRGYERIPGRGGLSALTVAGAIGGWREALAYSVRNLDGNLPLARLFEDAVQHARIGFPATRTQVRNTAEKRSELEHVAGFLENYVGEEPLRAGARFRQVALASVLEHLAQAGLDDFYQGDLAGTLVDGLEAAGSPLRRDDLETFRASWVTPLSVRFAGHQVFNLPPPTQGLVSLIMAGLMDRIDLGPVDGFAYVHGILEATKRAFLVRDAHIVDPAFMSVDPTGFLADAWLDREARMIDDGHAAPWRLPGAPGDTVYLAAVDAHGTLVSFIQSIYWEFGSGVVIPETGIVWQNRGTSFSLVEDHPNCLRPRRLPFHTIQPALAELSDGRRLAYGTMGGEGQPQTQSMILSRYAKYGVALQESVSAPRWLLGRTWGDESTRVRIEPRIRPEVLEALRRAGHDLQIVEPFDEAMGHAGALACHPDGLIEGASDPRCDGRAAAL
jgi:gamma-glutamyltranspeptidase